MDYKYISVYKLVGVTRPTGGGKEQVLIEYPSVRAKAVLTYDVNSHLFELDRASVVGLLMLKGLLGQGSKDNFEEELTNALANMRERRKREIGDGVFVKFEASGKVETFNPKEERELPEFVIALGGIQKQPIRAQLQPLSNGILASFSIGSERVTGAKKVSDGVFLIREDNKPVYSYSIEVSGNLSVSSGLSDDTIRFVTDKAKALGKRQDLVDTARLLARSLDERNDDLLTFLSVWSGLEIFVNKNFKDYEKMAFMKLSGRDASTLPHKFVQRIKSVMKDKYRLSDKFSVLSFELASSSSYEEDIDKFEQIKNIRDKLMHGQEVHISSLPIDETRMLLCKYLKLHMQRSGA